VLFDQLFGSKLHIFIKKIDFQQLFFIVPRFKKVHVNIEEKTEIYNWEEISHRTKSDISSVVVIIVGIKEKVESESTSLPHKLVILYDGVGHVIIPFG
jgi:hypothetical protein